MPIPEDRRRMKLFAHLQEEPGLIDLPAGHPWLLGYDAQFRADLPEGCDWIWRHLPRQGPKGWGVVVRACDGYVCLHERSGIAVVATGRREADGQDWLHLALSHRERLVIALELAAAKDDFFGKHATAIVVLPGVLRANPSNWGAEHLFWCPAGMDDIIPNFARIATVTGDGPTILQM